MSNNKSHKGAQKTPEFNLITRKSNGKSGKVKKQGSFDPKPPASQGADKNPVENSKNE